MEGEYGHEGQYFLLYVFLPWPVVPNSFPQQRCGSAWLRTTDADSKHNVGRPSNLTRMISSSGSNTVSIHGWLVLWAASIPAYLLICHNDIMLRCTDIPVGEVARWNNVQGTFPFRPHIRDAGLIYTVMRSFPQLLIWTCSLLYPRKRITYIPVSKILSCAGCVEFCMYPCMNYNNERWEFRMWNGHELITGDMFRKLCILY